MLNGKAGQFQKPVGNWGDDPNKYPSFNRKQSVSVPENLVKKGRGTGRA